jgi:hypothetical protein
VNFFVIYSHNLKKDWWMLFASVTDASLGRLWCRRADLPNTATTAEMTRKP